MCRPFGRIAMHAPILRYFTTVAELSTIREAWRRLHVSASAINRQILNLEDLIGEPVFERRRTGLHLTEAGEIVFRHCRNTLHDFARMTGEIDARRSRVTGTVQILTLDSMTVQFLPQSMRASTPSTPWWRYTSGRPIPRSPSVTSPVERRTSGSGRRHRRWIGSGAAAPARPLGPRAGKRRT